MKCDAGLGWVPSRSLQGQRHPVIWEVRVYSKGRFRAPEMYRERGDTINLALSSFCNIRMTKSYHLINNAS